MGLRLREGVDLAAIAARFGLRESSLCDPGKLEFYASLGLVWSECTRIGVTGRGMPVLDAVLGELVPAELVA